MRHNFILITLVKNEEEFLPITIESLLSSDVRPILWIILDDLSTDNTSNIIKKYSEKNSFIKYLTLDKKNMVDLINGRLSYLCNIGFNYAINYCKLNNLEWDFIGLLDADIKLSKNYFSNLIKEMNMDKKLGIVSGDAYININNKLVLETTCEDRPRGGLRLIKKKCFNDIHGYQISPSPDSVSNIKAKRLGWNIKVFPDYTVIHLRPTSSKNQLWNGYKIKGKGYYFFNMHPLLLFLNLMNILFSSKYYLILPLINGYMSYYLSKKPQINDVYIKYYYRYVRLREILVHV